MVRRVFGILCIVVLLASAVGYAATTGRMKGKVSDNDGLALPGVTVQISSVNLIGGPQVAISGVDGGFTFNMLPIGMYTVSVSLSGFSPATGEVRVQLDRLATVEFLLVPEQFGGEIEVLAEVPIVDTAQVNTQQVFDQDFLQNAAIGASGRDYLSIIGQVAGVAGDANASVFGGMQTDNAFLIDGLNTTDPVTGTFGTNFNYDAIQEVSFQTGGFEAEFGQATGGIINLVTKSGGNEFSGSFDVRFRDQSFIESGEHFDPDEEVSSFRDVSATLGGPILRDKLWFFVSGEDVKTEIRWEDTHFPRVYEGQNYIAKTTWQMADSHRAVFKYSTDPAEIPGANISQFVLESAKYTQKQGGDIWQAEFNSVLSESVPVNAKLGIVRGLIEGGPSSNPDTWSTHWNEDTGISSHNYRSTFADDRDRDEFGVHLSWFLDDFAGSHEFKFGVEYNDLYFGSVNYPNGGGQIDDVEEGFNYADLNGDGYFNHLVTIKEPEEDARNKENSYGDITTFFVQDSWRPMANLTVKPGLRFDNIGLSNHVGEDIADMDRWQPRFGVAWDIGGHAKYVLRASWGRFMDPTALSIPSFASGIPTSYQDYSTLEYWCNVTRGRHCTVGEVTDYLRSTGRLDDDSEAVDWTNGEGYTYTLFETEPPSVYEPAQTLDQAGVGHLETPYAEEMIIAFEMQVAPETSVELTYIDKQTKSMIEDTCSNNTWIWTDDPAPSLDDPSSWTTLGDCDHYMITNIDSFYREYNALIAKVETRGDWWHGMLSWTHSESKGNATSDATWSYAQALGDAFPTDFYNRDGYLGDHRENRFKWSGYLLLPWDVTVGLDGWWSDVGHQTVHSTCLNHVGADEAVLDFYGITDEQQQYCYSGDGYLLGTIFLEPRGSTKTKSVWNMDFQVSKAFSLGSYDLSAIFSVYNLFGHEQDRAFNSTAFRQTTEETGLGDPVDTGNRDIDGNILYDYYIPIGKPLGYGLPRRYEIGFRVEF